MYVIMLLYLCVYSRDLKRDISKKLDKLERRTQKAIVELIRMCKLLMCIIDKDGGNYLKVFCIFTILNHLDVTHKCIPLNLVSHMYRSNELMIIIIIY